jgi:hypothetical protein
MREPVFHYDDTGLVLREQHRAQRIAAAQAQPGLQQVRHHEVRRLAQRGGRGGG